MSIQNKKTSEMQPNEWLNWICDSKNVDVIKQKYNQWADDYDVCVGTVWDTVPRAAASMLAKVINDRQSLIIDVGAGTGLAGVALASFGFQRLMAVDLSQEMLSKAKQKSIYESLICCAIDDEKFQALPRAFGMIATGVFAEKHAGANELNLLHQKMLVGGIVVFTVRQSFLPQLESALNQPVWQLLASEVLPVYDDPVHLFAYKRAT